MIYFDKQPIDVSHILSDSGPLAEAFESYESRPQQVEMARAVDAALGKKYHLAVEAGTGVGKSFAYLIPAIKQIVGQNGKVLISTYTINLQEQLINKDIPFLAEYLGFDFTASLAKGRGNYLCKRRLEHAFSKQAGLFDEVTQNLRQLSKWAAETKNGSLSDLDFVPPSQVWDMVQSEHGNCKGRKCSHYAKCFYWRARRQLDKSDIIVANHSLLFSDLVLKGKSPMGVLPEYQFVILDEAHNIESVAEEHFGIDISSYGLNFTFNRLHNPNTKRGLIDISQEEIVRDIKNCVADTKLFFRQVDAWLDNVNGGGASKCPANFVDDNITPSIKDLRARLNGLIKNSDEEDDIFELQSVVDRLREIEAQIRAFLNQSVAEHVYWVETSGKRKFARLKSAPVNAAKDIKESLFDRYQSVILTSATLSCGPASDGQPAGFDFLASRIGLGEHTALMLGSPFDYAKQVKLYIETGMPEPNSVNFVKLAVEKLKKYLEMTGGKAFVLFTSYQMLRKTADLMSHWMAEHDMTLLQQGSNFDRTTLLRMFKEDTNSVLFGTASFWQGVDVPGTSLSNVIITKLPFAVPNHPLIEGKIEQIRANGGNPFYQYQLPEAVIKFKQGFGRLIRSHSDSGIIAILDSRVMTKPYGKLFLNAIPKCEVIHCKD